MIRSLITNWWNDLWQKRFSPENPHFPLTGGALESWLGGTRESASGFPVGPHQALMYSPVWAAVSLISKDVMRIPWFTYRRDGEDVREKAFDHPTFNLLRRETNVPNGQSHMTANVWIQRMLSHALLHRGAYSRIHRTPDGRPQRLEWLHSDRVEPMRRDGMLRFLVSYDGFQHETQNQGFEVLEEWDIFHINGLSIDALGGLSVVSYARNSFGRQLATEQYADDFYRNFGLPTGFFKHPQELSDPAVQKFMRRMAALYGRGNRHKFGLLEEGMDFTKTSINPKDAVLIEAMKWGIPEVARWFGVPLHKLADDTRSGYNTTEAENRAFVNSTLGAWINTLEMQANSKMFSLSERSQFFTEFDIDAYTRGNTLDRANANKVKVEWGWKTRNEVRKEENLNPLEGLDDPLTPLNMTTDIDAAQEDDDAPVTAEIDTTPALALPAPTRDLIAMHGVAEDAFKRMGRRLGNAAERAARKPDTFMAFVNELESEHSQSVNDALTPACRLANTDPKEATANLITEARELMLTACECQPDELTKSVQRAAGELTNGLASQLAKGLFDEN